VSAASVETAVTSSLLMDPPPVWVAPSLLRALGLSRRPADIDLSDSLERVATTPERAA
jgi:hypothetical protein